MSGSAEGGVDVTTTEMTPDASNVKVVTPVSDWSPVSYGRCALATTLGITIDSLGCMSLG